MEKDVCLIGDRMDSLFSHSPALGSFLMANFLFSSMTLFGVWDGTALRDGWGWFIMSSSSSLFLNRDIMTILSPTTKRRDEALIAIFPRSVNRAAKVLERGK